QKIIPALEWLKKYERSDISKDLSAGLIVAVMLVPQGMAYAMLAGLPPVIGLYASTFPLIAYALFGSSRQLAVGPVAMISLLVFSGVSKLAQPGSEQYVSLVLLLSLMVGVIQVTMGVLRMGSFVNFLSHAVISGFTSAAAIVIWLSQLNHLLGIKLSAGHSVIHLVAEAGQRIGETHPVTLAIGMASIALLLIFKRKMPNFPAPLLILAGSALVVGFLRLDRMGVKIVGDVPRGLPDLSLPTFRPESFGILLPTALTVLFVGFMESIAVAESIAAKERYKIDSNLELKGLGLANIVSSFLSGCPVTGGFSRTAVNYQAGARTPLASIFTALIVILTILLLTPLFYYLPKAVLAAIIMVAVIGLIDVRGAKHLFRVKKIDGWTYLLTFIATLVFGSQKGILMGVTFSLLVFIWRSSHPHTAEIGYLEKEDVFRNVNRFPEAKTFPEVLILRIDASLYFANMAFCENLLRKRIVDKPDLKWILIDLSGVNDVDAVAIQTLEEMMKDYQEKGIDFVFAGMKGPVRDLVASAGWDEKYGQRVEYFSIKHALRVIGIMK
ncbi:MAG: SulP family inorganic anion transporter, partial [Thermodesulfobacteriota bacterium]